MNKDTGICKLASAKWQNNLHKNKQNFNLLKKLKTTQGRFEGGNINELTFAKTQKKYLLCFTIYK